MIDAEPDVFAHNLETVRRLHPRIRPAFGYERTLEVLRIAKRLRPAQITKSNLILGMGETPSEVAAALADLRDAGCEIVTMGQYLRPTPMHLPVDRWVTPDEFAEHKASAKATRHPARRGRSARSQLVPRRRTVPASRRGPRRRDLSGTAPPGSGGAGL